VTDVGASSSRFGLPLTTLLVSSLIGSTRTLSRSRCRRSGGRSARRSLTLWVISVHVLTYAALLLAAGNYADLKGRKTTMVKISQAVGRDRTAGAGMVLARLALRVDSPGQGRDRCDEFAWIHRLEEMHLKAISQAFVRSSDRANAVRAAAGGSRIAAFGDFRMRRGRGGFTSSIERDARESLSVLVARVRARISVPLAVSDELPGVDSGSAVLALARTIMVTFSRC
jgi:hypothetical protein